MIVRAWSVWDEPGAIERLKFLLTEEGCVASVAARKLSEEFNTRVTRNAVIGKMHRLKIKQRKLEREPKPPRVYVPKIRLRKPRNVIEFKKPEPTPRDISINQLRRGVCHYPLATINQRPPYIYCGAPSTDVKEMYCDKHYQIMHVKARKEWK